MALHAVSDVNGNREGVRMFQQTQGERYLLLGLAVIVLALQVGFGLPQQEERAANERVWRHGAESLCQGGGSMNGGV